MVVAAAVAAVEVTVTEVVAADTEVVAEAVAAMVDIKPRRPMNRFLCIH